MRISQWGEYGILFSLYIARREKEGCPVVGAAEIARAEEVALQYAQQILQRLRRGGIIMSVRGPQGGYRLSRPAAEINLFHILTATEGAGFEVICETKPLNNSMCPRPECPLRPMWFALRNHIDFFLASCTLEDLLRKPIKTNGPMVSKKGDEGLSGIPSGVSPINEVEE